MKRRQVKKRKRAKAATETAVKRKKAGRPAQYVQFEGRTIGGLSGPKSPIDVDGRYYSTHNDPLTRRREYFGRDLEEAVRLFAAWKRKKAAKACN